MVNIHGEISISKWKRILQRLISNLKRCSFEINYSDNLQKRQVQQVLNDLEEALQAIKDDSSSFILKLFEVAFLLLGQTPNNSGVRFVKREKYSSPALRTMCFFQTTDQRFRTILEAAKAGEFKNHGYDELFEKYVEDFNAKPAPSRPNSAHRWRWVLKRHFEKVCSG